MNADTVDVDDFEVSGDTPDEAVEEQPQAAAPAQARGTVEQPAGDEPEPDPASEAGKTLAKHRRSLQGRIDGLVKARSDAEARAEAAERRARELEQRSAGGQPEPRQPQYLTRPKPVLDEFSNESDPYAAWLEAVADWKADEKLAARDQASSQAYAQRAHQDVVATYQKRLDDVRTKHADFDAVIAENADLEVSPVMREYILTDERGPEMQRYLCLNHEDHARIMGLSPARQLVELGKLEARLDAASSGPAQKPVVTKAKPPIKPVGSSPVASDEEEVSSDTTDDFDRHVTVMNARDRRTRRR